MLGQPVGDVNDRQVAKAGNHALDHSRHMERKGGDASRVLGEVGTQDGVLADPLDRGAFLVGQHTHHFLRGDPRGQHAADERSGAGSDVHVEVVDRRIDGQEVEGAKGAYLVDAAGESAAAEDQRRARALLLFGIATPFLGVLDVYDLAHAHPIMSAIRVTFRYLRAAACCNIR